MLQSCANVVVEFIEKPDILGTVLLSPMRCWAADGGNWCKHASSTIEDGQNSITAVLKPKDPRVYCSVKRPPSDCLYICNPLSECDHIVMLNATDEHTLSLRIYSAWNANYDLTECDAVCHKIEWITATCETQKVCDWPQDNHKEPNKWERQHLLKKNRL